jgi:prepilin-type N-terminal cleavage/methylation domain-containing protein
MASNRRRGFTLIELLVFAAIFSIVVVVFLTVMVEVINIQARETNQAEVQGQSQFLLQRVQYYVENASLVDVPQDTPTATLKLYLGVNAQDPTYLTLASGTVYLQQTATGTLQALTSNRVIVSNLSFTRRANPPGHDAVNVAFTIAYNSPSPLQLFSQALQTTVARVSAATFDSDLVPSSTGKNLGLAANMWLSVNQDIWFNGANVGVGGSSFSPVGAFEVYSGNARVDSGDVYIVNNANGLVLRDPTNACWRLRVNASGTLSTTGISCPP